MISEKLRKENIIKNIIDGLMKHGYDIFINNNEIIILHDGYVKTTPLDNTLNLMNDETFPMTVDDIIELLIDQHKTKKDISDGKYDDLQPMTSKELHEYLVNLNKK